MNPAADITIIKRKDNWIMGKLKAYQFEVKRFDEPNEVYGLKFNEELGASRISKLWVARGFTTVCSYDRGWDVLPTSKEDQDTCEAIIRFFN